jgi:hypothetical protein
MFRLHDASSPPPSLRLLLLAPSVYYTVSSQRLTTLLPPTSSEATSSEVHTGTFRFGCLVADVIETKKLQRAKTMTASRE